MKKRIENMREGQRFYGPDGCIYRRGKPFAQEERGTSMLSKPVRIRGPGGRLYLDWYGTRRVIYYEAIPVDLQTRTAWFRPDEVFELVPRSRKRR